MKLSKISAAALAASMFATLSVGAAAYAAPAAQTSEAVQVVRSPNPKDVFVRTQSASRAKPDRQSAKGDCCPGPMMKMMGGASSAPNSAPQQPAN